MTDLTAEAIERIADYAVAADDAEHPLPFRPSLDAPTIVRVLDDRRHLEVVHLEQYLEVPLRLRGLARVDDPGSLIAYVNRLANANTTLWAHEATACVAAVFNDHANSELAGWRDHGVELRLLEDPDWRRWLEADGHLGAQEWFAELIEDLSHTIVSPDSAAMYTIARTFRAHTRADFNRSTHLDSGDIALSFTEETTAKAGSRGEIEVPERFELRLAPFIGADPVNVTARLRYRIKDGELKIGYKLLRPDVARREAFDELVEQIDEGTLSGVPMHYGVRPDSVTPQR
ncbi:DUF2303 family protein [Sciscionella sediminilitoris]|uniref:DUF2303 family protein n=1 Tax=Sciscionella sediminilitoris TaxID=1445613 RepID=UPI0004DF3F0F|nr:DUF2303 family protein [Sciscionella sp. SE31]